MKNIITLLVAVLITAGVFAQAPEKMGYQAVLRDASDVLITGMTVGMQISILEGSTTGTPVYVETQTPTTNANGLATLEVGTGTIVSGDFSSIDWGGGEYYIKTETDPAGGTAYSIEGTTQLLSVPYALFAKNGGGSGNTLDQAYDLEMTTSPTPRIIEADDGVIEIIATDNDALELTADSDFVGLLVNSESTSPGIYIEQLGTGDALNIATEDTGIGIDVNNSGLNIGMDIVNSNPANASEVINVENSGTGDAVHIDNLDGGGGNSLFIENDGGGDALDIANDGGGDAVTIDNDSAGDAVFIDNLDSVGGIALSINSDSGVAAVDVLNDGGGSAINVTNDGGGHGMLVTHSGAGNGINVVNDGTGIGLNILNGAVPFSGGGVGGAGIGFKLKQGGASKAVFIDNTGTANAVHILNGNPANGAAVVKIEQGGAGTALEIANGGPGKAAHFFNMVPLNAAEVLSVSTDGVGNAGLFVSTDNNANFAPTLVANHIGNGSAGEFLIMDEATGKVNDKPIINALSNGMGPGVAIDLSNAETGADSNTAPALFASHKGFGNGAFIETFNTDNSAATLEIKNNGSGHGAHIDSYDNGGDTEATLYVEQGNSSTVAVLGRTAVFDLHPTGTSADSAVLIRSDPSSTAHSTLRVIRGDPTKSAADFFGDVHISSDLVVDGSFSAAAKAFKIDHPLDPDNMYLIHNSIESNERINIYSGNITTNKEGYATVDLPEYMSALNKDFKYQLTIIDKSFAQAIIWEPMNSESNSFVIKTNAPSICVSWQITGTRQDTWAKENPMQVEVNKNSGL